MIIHGLSRSRSNEHEYNASSSSYVSLAGLEATRNLPLLDYSWTMFMGSNILLWQRKNYLTEALLSLLRQWRMPLFADGVA